MPFQKGHQKFKGRPKGGKNQKTTDWETLRDYAIMDGAAKFREEINKLKGRTFCEVYIKALEFYKPKLARSEVTGLNGAPLSLIQIINDAKSNRQSTDGDVAK